MKCISWQQCSCFVLVQILFCAGCNRPASTTEGPAVHLIIHEDYRGPIEFSETNDDGPNTSSKQSVRVKVSDRGYANIDALWRLQEQKVLASLSSGETLKTHDLKANEIGLRTATIFREHVEELETEYFIGDLRQFTEYLESEHGDWRANMEHKRHIYESSLGMEGGEITRVTEEALSGSPAWDGAGNPPLSYEQCVAIATDAAESERIANAGGWVPHVERVSLVNRAMGLTDQWYWHVHFDFFPASGGMGGMAPTLDIIVRMDGRVVPPEIGKNDNY